MAQLLYQALLDIRAASYEQKSHKAIFKIANIFHNVPLQLRKVNKGEKSIDFVLQDIHDRAEREGKESESWLLNVLKNIETS